MANGKPMSVREAASKLGVSLQQVYKLLWDGKLVGQRIDGKWSITSVSVQARLTGKAGSK